MADSRRSSHDRQVELTDAALDIIATHGIAALTTRRLAAQVGLTSGAIFRHFASIEALLDAVVSRVEAVLEAGYPPADLPPLERLERFVEARSTAVGDRIGILRLVLSDQFRLALPEGGSQRIAACIGRTRAFITQCLREGQGAGEVRTDLAAEALAPIVMGTVQVLALSTAQAAGGAIAAREVRAALSTIIRPPTPAPPGNKKESS